MGLPLCYLLASLAEWAGASLKASLDSEALTGLLLPLAGLTVNGQIIGDKRDSPDSKSSKTYFGKLGIANAQMDFQIEVTPEKITLRNGAAQSTFSWLDTVTVRQDG